MKDETPNQSGLERRGSVPFGTLRDDAFERKLNWLREHKRLVKVVEWVLIALLVTLVFLVGIN